MASFLRPTDVDVIAGQAAEALLHGGVHVAELLRRRADLVFGGC
jgi:hypothetical protein